MKIYIKQNQQFIALMLCTLVFSGASEVLVSSACVCHLIIWRHSNNVLSKSIYSNSNSTIWSLLYCFLIYNKIMPYYVILIVNNFYG